MDTFKRNKLRTEIARKIRALREERHWTQADLSKGLGLSQSRFSEIERGQGSFTAEQFLEILKLFNVPFSHFAMGQNGPGSGIQNALARLGAIHLRHRSDVLPSERLDEAGDVVREVLLGAESPRHITSLAPVLVRNIDRINLNRLHAQFLEYGLERRLAWLVENTLMAVRDELSVGLPRKEAIQYGRAEFMLGAFLENLPFDRSRRNSVEALDILDTRILSEKKLQDVRNSTSTISDRWGIATALQPDDFIEALRASHVADSNPPARLRSPLGKVGAEKAPASDHLPSPSDAPDKPPTRNEGHRLLNQIDMDWD